MSTSNETLIRNALAKYPWIHPAYAHSVMDECVRDLGTNLDETTFAERVSRPFCLFVCKDGSRIKAMYSDEHTSFFHEVKEPIEVIGVRWRRRGVETVQNGQLVFNDSFMPLKSSVEDGFHYQLGPGSNLEVRCYLTVSANQVGNPEPLNLTIPREGLIPLRPEDMGREVQGASPSPMSKWR